ncbi:hypothetical protein QAD02_001733, partial [Eretmocerus hayati]
VQEGPVSPASSSLSNPSAAGPDPNDQVLLATMQPVSVLELHHDSSPLALHAKYSHHHHHPKYSHKSSEVGEVRVQVPSPEPEVSEHKMIDLIYNDGQKTVMYTHDKEIIYESEADRVQVVEYPPPPPTPPSPPPHHLHHHQSHHRVTNPGGILSGVTRSPLHLHYPHQLQLQHEHELGRGPGGTPTTTTVLVLSELVAGDPGATALPPGHLTLASAAASLRAA